MAGNGTGAGRSVASKISAILLAVAGSRHNTLTELADGVGLPVSTVHRLATDLADWGILERDACGRFTIGSRLCRASGGLEREVQDREGELRIVRDRAAPVAEDLCRTTGLSVRVGVLDDGQVAYAEKVSRHRPMSQPAPAARLPAHATALGKALLAFSSVREVDAAVRRGLPRFTPFTISTTDRLHLALRTIRRTRVAVSDRELDESILAIAAPIFGDGGRIAAAIELKVHDLVYDVPVLVAPLAVAAGCLSRELTGSAPAEKNPVVSRDRPVQVL
jgi:DNA-binding IclR family transcriptional regulator